VGVTVNREFEFTERDFVFIRDFLRQRAGIVLHEGKRDMVYSRLARRLRALGLSRFDDYCRLLARDGDEEAGHFMNALTTNLTAFFREPHHFDFLAETLVPDLLRRRARGPIRIWSAGCSTGEEPYSIAMTLREALPTARVRDVRILATDLDTEVLATARRGIYPMSRLEGLPRHRLQHWFRRGEGSQANRAKVSDEIQEMVHFRTLNLMESWPMQGPFDAIFCRNVVIYFDKPTQKRLVSRFAEILIDGGHLFLGHSETLYQVSNRFRLLGNTIYRKEG